MSCLFLLFGKRAQDCRKSTGDQTGRCLLPCDPVKNCPSQELDYSDKTAIVIEVVVAIEAVVIVVEEEQTALQVARPPS